ncbi:Carbonic anhydrase, beta class [hydrothermal vent metagenome]|uniref:carbonic anhydrase n=1 Tax=hydrothermal vent metagenome TaxID=652676 RepID=A0A3B0RFZ2_9ZZZZ
MNTFPPSLLAGYAKFRNGRFADESKRYQALAKRGQTPKILVVACCDSRAAPETIFNAGPGEMFVIRNVANLVPPRKPDGECHSTSAALEFAIESLRVEHILVLGHGRCGGVAAALASNAQTKNAGDFIGKWMQLLAPSTAQVLQQSGLTDAQRHTMLERASIQYSLENLRSFPSIRQLENTGKLQLHGGWFDISRRVMDTKPRNRKFPTTANLAYAFLPPPP